MNKWIQVFDEYVSRFDMNNHDIDLKYRHSKKVMKLSTIIAKSLGLSEEDIIICSFIGLVHDLGRFEQIKKYNTYDDTKSFNHAKLSVELLFTDNMIKMFNIDKKYYDIIKSAVFNHNRHKIDSKLKGKKLLFAKIIRDADKIDIFRIITVQEVEIEVGGKLRESILNQFYKKESIIITKNMSKNEVELLRFSTIFDVNYNISLQIIKEKKYIEKLYNIICRKSEDKTIFKNYYNITQKYIEEELKEI